MKSRILKVLNLIIFSFTSMLIFGQTADEIINKHIEAHGGLENWNKVEALKVQGNFTAFSIEKPFTAYKTNTGTYYADLYLGEQAVKESFDGVNAWTIDPWQDFSYARKITEGEQNVFSQKAEFFTPFLNYKQKGHKVSYLGLDTIDGIELFVLDLTRSNGKIEKWYLNTKTYLEYMCHSEWVDFAYAVPAESFFDDFREVDGLILPFFTERTFLQRDRILLVENVEINPEIDSKIYTMPTREEIKKLDFLEGDWDVKLSVWTRRGNWYDLGSTSSSIQHETHNMLQEKITYERNLLVTRISQFTYNEDYDNYRMSAFNDLNGSLEVLVGNFKGEDLIFENTNVYYEEIKDEGRKIFQVKFMEITADGFELIVNVTNDEGKTWQPMDKFTYSRKVN